MKNNINKQNDNNLADCNTHHLGQLIEQLNECDFLELQHDIRKLIVSFQGTKECTVMDESERSAMTHRMFELMEVLSELDNHVIHKTHEVLFLKFEFNQ